MNNDKAKSSLQPSQKRHLSVVVIGASAGGIKALKQLFSLMPADSGMAFVVILHLLPHHESNLAAIFQTQTAMPVTQVCETIKVEPNCIYVIPPDKNLAMVDGHIELTEPQKLQGKRTAIDLFFRTLADGYGKNAVAVVLSGTGSDGTSGLKRVKEHGGFTFVQDPSEAEYDGMPRSAIATNLADLVLPVEEIPARLINLRRTAEELDFDNDEKPPPEISREKTLREILTLLKIRTGHDFYNYKRPTLLRRVARRLQVHGLTDIADYLAFLRENPEELNALLADLLISVTNFFRDKETFEALESKVVPKLFAGKTSADTIRVWVCGCATGEEAYSLAMLLCEYADGLPDAPKIQIFASDINESAIASARECRYDESIAVDVSPERLRRFFVKKGDTYQVKKHLREMVLFAPHNVLRDPPFSKLDLVSCRNLLIYLARDTQEKVLEIFNFGLNVNGFLFLGASETADSADRLFSVVDKKQRIYKASASAKNKIVPALPLSGGRREFKISELPKSAEQEPFASFGELHHRTVELYAPPSVIINETDEIVHLSKNAGRFLHYSGGELSRNLLKIINPALRNNLRTALLTARQENRPAEVRNIRAVIDAEEILVNLIVRPVIEPEVKDFLLVLFETAGKLSEAETSLQPVKTIGDESESAMRRLEDELHSTKSRLRSNVEQAEISTEELKASNEELQATNEELLSTTEELETGKEELQSTVEELQTVNQELKIKIEELSVSNSDFQNLMTSTDIGTIFLDRDLRIKMFTPRVLDIFNLINSDIGRPFSDVTGKLAVSDLFADAETVLSRLQTVEREVKTVEERWFLARVLPYRAAEDQISGVVLTFLDITSRKRQEEELRESETFVRSTLNSLVPSIAILDCDGKILDVNNAWARFAEENRCNSPRNGIGVNYLDVMRHAAISGEPDAQLIFDGIEAVLSGNLPKYEVEYPCHSPTEQRWFAMNASPLDTTGGGAVVSHTDITTRKLAEQSIRFQARLLNTIEQAAIATDLDGKITYWNHFAEKLYGWTAEEASGQNIVETATPEIMAEQADEIMSRLRRGESWSGEFTVRRRDGTTFPAQVIDSPIADEKGNLIGVIGVSVDITKRKRTEEKLRRSEERLRLLIESAHDYAIITLSTDGSVNSWNTGAERLFGYKEAEIITRSGSILFTPEDRAANIPELEIKNAVEKGFAEDERWHLRKDKTRFYVSGVMRPLTDADGNLLGFVKIARDMTERSKILEELRLAHENLEIKVEERTAELADSNESLQQEIIERRQLETERKRLLTKIVNTQEDERRRIARDLHDHLGQQLTALRLKLEILRELCGDDHLCGQIKEVQTIAGKVDSDVDFLAWELRPSALDDFGIVAALGNYVAEWSRQFDVPSEFTCRSFDKKRLAPEAENNLYRIAQEALNNVAKHARAKSVDVLLEHRDDFAVMIIEDDGIGFEPDKQLVSRKNGRGLGLIGMRERAALLGGSLEIESAPGAATTIFVRVPVSNGKMEKKENG